MKDKEDFSDLIQEREQEIAEGKKNTIKALSKVSGVGFAFELYDLLTKPSLEFRFQKWIKIITKRLSELEEKQKIDFKNLREDEEFITILVQASQIAVRNHEEEKINALKNAVINTALTNDLEYVERQMMVNLIDRITSLHIKILKIFNDPEEWLDKNDISFSSSSFTNIRMVLDEALPEIRSNRTLPNQCWIELYNNGLVEGENTTHAPVDENGKLKPMTTDFGDSFLEFIVESS